MSHEKSMTHPPDSLHLLEGSRALFPAIIESINHAKHTVYLETYIFDVTASGELVAIALEQAALRGVNVRLIIDGYGSSDIDEAWVARFKAAGVQLMIYEPMVTLGIFIPSQWRRLHRKLCAVDEETAFCGGINILDDWYDPNHGALASPRFDFSVRVTGETARKIHLATQLLWERLAKDKFKDRFKDRFHDTSLVLRRAITAAETMPLVLKRSHLPAHLHTGYALTALVLRDNISNRGQIERAYLKAIGEARQEIVIANAYFVPGVKLRRALILAAKRGVKVQILLQGKYEYFMQYHAARPIYGSLLAAGVEIYEYDKSFLHAKVATIDGVWATVGSSNLDPLSLLLAREANIVIQDSEFTQSLRLRLHAAMKEGKRVDAAQMANRRWSQRLNEMIAFVVMRTGLWLFGKRY